MNSTYDVYVHPKRGQWGVNVQGSTINVCDLTDSHAKVGQIAPHKLASEVTRRLRMGYTKLPKAKYLSTEYDDAGILKSSFVESHPDLAAYRSNALVVVLSHEDDAAAISAEFYLTLENVDVDNTELDRWVDRVAKATAYLVAPNTRPAFALVLAQWAITKGRILMGEPSKAPQCSPSEAPLLWKEWLVSTYGDTTEVQRVQEQLGWSLRDQLGQAAPSDPNQTEAPSGTLAMAALNAF